MSKLLKEPTLTKNLTHVQLTQFLRWVSKDYRTKKEMYRDNKQAYNIAKYYGLLDRFFQDGRAGRPQKWNEETIKSFVKKGNIKTKKDLKTRKIAAYRKALELGIIDELGLKTKKELRLEQEEKTRQKKVDWELRKKKVFNKSLLPRGRSFNEAT